MKDFDYYKTCETPWPDQGEIEKGMAEAIAEIPMTKSERIEAESNIKQRAKEEYLKQRLVCRAEEKVLEEEFYKDCREEFGYDKFLTEQGCAILESKADQEGHAYGYSEIFNHLCDLTEFVERILKEKRVP